MFLKMIATDISSYLAKLNANDGHRFMVAENNNETTVAFAYVSEDLFRKMVEEDPAGQACPGSISKGGRYVEVETMTDDFPLMMGFRDTEHDKKNQIFYVQINNAAGVEGAKTYIYDFLMLGAYPSEQPQLVQ